MKNVIITGGGSGGHMYPALAIAEKFKEKGYNVIYVGGDQLENHMWPKEEFQYCFIHASGREFGGIKELFNIIKRNIKGIFEASKILKEYRPVAVVGTGGYVEFPVIIAAKLRGVPSFIQEQNAIPGRANLILSSFVNKIFLGFNEARSEFKDESKLIFSGNPVRDIFKLKNKKSSRKTLGYMDDDFIILLTGGSLGAPKINEIAIELAIEVSKMDNIRMILSTGIRYIKEVNESFKEKGISIGRDTNIEVYPYIDNMADYLASADFVIERSGAISCAETISKGIPSLMIPSTYVYKNHQYYNAKAISDFGASVLMEEKDLDATDAVKKVLDIIKDRDVLSKMREKALELSTENTLDIIYEVIDEEINGNK